MTHDIWVAAGSAAFVILVMALVVPLLRAASQKWKVGQEAIRYLRDLETRRPALGEQDKNDFTPPMEQWQKAVNENRKVAQEQFEQSVKLLASILEQVRQSNEYLFMIARCERGIAKLYRGGGYDEVDDERGLYLDRVSELVDKYGLSREEAEQRARSEHGGGKVYTRSGMGLDRQ